MKILIVDDVPGVIQEIKNIISPKITAKERMQMVIEKRVHAGDAFFEFLTATNTDDALAAIAEAEAHGAPFDLVITDMKMPPGRDGIEIVREATNQGCQATFFICSAYSGLDKEHLVASAHGQPERVFDKPIPVVELKQAVDAVVARRKHAQ